MKAIKYIFILALSGSFLALGACTDEGDSIAPQVEYEEAQDTVEDGQEIDPGEDE